uniref:TLC domain-containing protein n=1 Tax=Chromera velia CCMP2878 TaxID=1169474 RepID=A0A0G4GJ97_9ALVE|eukprot:Cvel_22136.t1-p1 / transcript=Cvel_22136.t1 / gene=Cvel_22136 / organism=Chromera_velia_CCMP2878 / gene_product=hypothetical protein / transcript_product=hypothetical protein / location=Cvel_scaffold2146:27610-31161(+) / protein_length=254 / sequence_SO=supercontig / SO=protein_coding / is_pseudo=false
MQDIDLLGLETLYTQTGSQLMGEFVLFLTFTCLILTYHFIAKFCVSLLPCNPPNVRTAFAWMQTPLTASIMTASGICALLLLYKNDALIDPREFTQLMFDFDAQWPRLVVLYFAGHCVADTLLGATLYSDQFDIVSGWIHHTAYLLLMVGILVFGGCFGFVAFAIEELPTLGSLDGSPMRHGEAEDEEVDLEAGWGEVEDLERESPPHNDGGGGGVWGWGWGRKGWTRVAGDEGPELPLYRREGGMEPNRGGRQ